MISRSLLINRRDHSPERRVLSSDDAGRRGSILVPKMSNIVHRGVLNIYKLSHSAVGAYPYVDRVLPRFRLLDDDSGY